MVFSQFPGSNAAAVVDDLLDRFYGFEDADPNQMFGLLLERTGVIRELSPGVIDFVHNTFKEFLASEKFVEDGLYMPLVEHSSEPSWLPVLFFAAASPNERFVDKLLAEMISETENAADEIGSEKESFAATTVLTLVRAYAVAIVGPAKRDKVNALKSLVLPPRRLEDVPLLSSLGDDVLGDIGDEVPSEVEPAKALARLLGQLEFSRRKGKGVDVYPRSSSVGAH